MKVRLIDRILLAVLLIAVVVISLSLIVLSIRVYPLEVVQNIISTLYSSLNSAIILGACGLVLLIIAVRLMFAGSGKKSTEVQPTSSAALVRASELGSAFITLSAIDSMVQKHCRANNKIRSVESIVRNLPEGGVTVNTRLSLTPDTDVPELTGELQASLKEYVEKISGITVHEISILVEDISLNPKSRVD